MNIHLIAFNCRFSHSCLALFYVRQAFTKHLPNSNASIHQYTINDPYYETLLHITGAQPDVLCFSAYIWNAQYVSRLLADLKLVLPDLPIIIGGPQGPAMQKELPFPVTVVQGEIEGVDQSFYTDLASGLLKEQYNSVPVKNFNYPYIQDDFSSQLKNRNIYYESTRGCPFSCTYCLSSVSRGVAAKNIDTVRKELTTILHHSPSVIRFVDRTFNADPQRTIILWQFLEETADPSTCFHFEIAPELFTEEMFVFLEKLSPDRFQFEIGIQSTNPATLTAVNRKMNIDVVSDNVKRLLSFDNIHLHLDLILGLPFETPQTFKQSFLDVFALHPHYIQMGLLKTLPDTAIYKSKAEFGIASCSQPPYQVMATSWLNHEQLTRFYWLGECVEAFYNNRYFKTLFSYLHTSDLDPFEFFSRLLDVCFEKNLFKLAKTQKLLCEILHQYTQTIDPLFRELLIYDWLLCGHRFLPDCFNEDLKAPRDFLWNNMPEQAPNVYKQRERNTFFKRSIFFQFSGKMLNQIGLSETKEKGYVCFLPEQKPGVIKHCQTIFMPCTLGKKDGPDRTV